MVYDFSPLEQYKKLKRVRWSVGIALLVASVVAITVASMLQAGKTLTEWVAAISLAIVGLYIIFQAYLSGIAVTRFAKLNKLKHGLTTRPPVLKNQDYDTRTVNAYEFSIKGGVCSVYMLYLTNKDSRSLPVRFQYLSVAVLQNKKSYPHLYLDGKRNDIASAYVKSQRLSLEGDFDRSFNLYIPDSGQIDALSVFSPDLMQLLLDSGRIYDIEISNQQLFIITKGNVYDFQRLPALLDFAARLRQEFEQKDVVWQHATTPIVQGRPTKLRKRYRLNISSGWLTFLIIAVPIVVLFVAMFVMAIFFLLTRP